MLAAVVALAVIVAVVLLVNRPSDTSGPVPASSLTPPVPTTAAPSESTASPSPSASAATSAATSATPTAKAPRSTASEAPTDQPTTSSPVPIDKKAKIRPELSAEVSRLQSVNGTAQGPGEVAGPALRARISLTNGSKKPLNLSNTVVNLYYGADERPASALSGPGAKPLPTRVQAGRTVDGVFVFAVPKNARGDILITVDYSVKTPVVAFRGPGPT